MTRKFDFLVIGSGMAGISFALKAAQYGKVALLCKTTLSETNTSYAQGGIASVTYEPDTFEKHIEDTLIAGDGHCNLAAVEKVIREAPSQINELINWGIDFGKNEWFVLPPAEYIIEQKFQNFPAIDKFLKVNSGVITGADTIFIINRRAIPKGEENIYKQFLSDRKITSYKIYEDIEDYIFYPFENGFHLSAEDIENKYPKTWKYLLSHKEQLESRKSLPKEWWMLRSPSHPDNILIPKIVNPELTITPKFSFDNEGDFIVSHSSYLSLKSNDYDLELLYYFLGILNSTPCYWYISTHSNKYGSGYNKIQPKTLKNTPIPDPFKIDKKDLLILIKLVKERFNQNEESILQIEKEIDLLVCSLYGLTNEESQILLGSWQET